ncbi:hypothetical protein HX109_14440 [Galbibacter sp. BG1]|uniref:hypothetical protein n=1 Tax=Galbibacter sp. BG1 TaxID=1170699 RepID=UPI0015B9F9DF|nr:hypothetical protein [Galbibacter sp. BG1]QLE02699.1 hypothetical protein HX109_14440 [Galbibacter sp. BG1]
MNIILKKIKIKSNYAILLLALLAISVISCKQTKKEETTEDIEIESAGVIEEEDSMREAQVLLINEHQINDMPLTTKATIDGMDNSTAITEEVKENETYSESMTEAPPNADYEVHSKEDIHSKLEANDYIANEIEVDEAIVPLDETQTITSYNKKGKEKDSLQVVSDGNGNIDQIIFTHRHHKDVYDVQAGMSTKEVKKLRKDLKHMVKHGQVFLYDDTSNIMYLLDAKDAEGNEISEAEIETMSVQAIIWKDKNKDKKTK